MLKGKLWAHTLPQARGEMSSPGLSLPPWAGTPRSHRAGVALGVAALRGGCGLRQAGAVPGARGSGRAGRSLGWAAWEEGVRAEGWQRWPSLCSLPTSQPTLASHPWAARAAAASLPDGRQGLGLPRRCWPWGRCPGEPEATVSGPWVPRHPHAQAAVPVLGHYASPSTPPGCRAACPPRRRRGISQPSPDRIKEKYTSKQIAAS